MAKRVEEGKKQFAGMELPQHTLGVIGLGKIGSLVADAAIHLGMNVLGYDPEITVDAAWSLPAQVKKAHSIDEVLKASHFVTLHVPLAAADAQPDKREEPGAGASGHDTAQFFARRHRRQRGRGAGAGCAQAEVFRDRFPRQPAGRRARRDRAAAPRRVDARSRGQLCRDGRGPGARIPRARQHSQRGQFPRHEHAARVALPRRHRQRQRAQYGGADFRHASPARA